MTCMIDQTPPQTNRNKTGVGILCHQFGRSFKRMLHTEKFQKNSVVHQFDLQKIQCSFISGTYLWAWFQIAHSFFSANKHCHKDSISNMDKAIFMPLPQLHRLNQKLSLPLSLSPVQLGADGRCVVYALRAIVLDSSVESPELLHFCGTADVAQTLSLHSAVLEVQCWIGSNCSQI